MSEIFNEAACLEKLSRFLPAQAPLKDFVHHNTLHAFQKENFFDATRNSAIIFGNRTFLPINDYKKKYASGQISSAIINAVIKARTDGNQEDWWKKMFDQEEPDFYLPKIGQLRNNWKINYGIDMDGIVHPKIIRFVNAFIDQGIAFRPFPEANSGLLNAIKHIQKHSYVKLFKSKRAVHFLNSDNKSISELLDLIVGDERYFEQYLFDQQFGHPGLSGMICSIEKKPDSLNTKKPINLFDFIYLELLFELETLELTVNKNFKPLAIDVEKEPLNLFESEPSNDYWKVLELWQEAYEFSYYDQVLAGILQAKKSSITKITSQAFFCLDDREESIRRNIEKYNPECQTFGTPAHFSIEAKFKPYNANFATQICPQSIKPTHLIKEIGSEKREKKDIHFQNRTHQFFSGFILSQTVGFWSSLKLVNNIFNPQESAAQYKSESDHMNNKSLLLYENSSGREEDHLKIGFTTEEMIGIVYNELSNTGLTENFASIIYFFGHGGSSTNNPYFAGYNCGACSGRPSSLNARLFALIANKKVVRAGLKKKGIQIPPTTQFIGAYHDTTQDTFTYYEEDVIPEKQRQAHTSNKKKFALALDQNAKERSRQFLNINSKKSSKKIHKKIINRSRALFEPRPEYNHSNNALFIIGNRKLTRNLFLDQRAFLNSYDYKNDSEGVLLRNILNAGTGVCGGINLEYFFSTVDNQKFGAGSKLPQNIFGLYGVANGVKGDLRPGLPWQMIDTHEPIRILTIVEQRVDIVLEAVKSNPSTYEWYKNEWMKLAVFDPYTKQTYLFSKDHFEPYIPIQKELPILKDVNALIESEYTISPVYQLG